MAHQTVELLSWVNVKKIVCADWWMVHVCENFNHLLLARFIRTVCMRRIW